MDSRKEKIEIDDVNYLICFNTNMEVLLRKKKFEVQDEISNLQKSIQRANDTIERLKSGKSKYGFNPTVMIKKYTEDLGSFRTKLKENQNILDAIENGTYEDTFRQNELQQHVSSSRTKKSNMSRQQQQNPDKKQLRSQNTSNYNSVQYEIKRYFRDCQSIPQYIEDKLDNLPEDKGYIWRDIWCFGRLPRERKHALTLFEKKYDRLYIHEYDRAQRIYSLFEKNPHTGEHVLVDRYSI
jgi:hypothetical protein